MLTVTFEPWGSAVQVEQGCTVLDAARAADISMGAVCGGRGTCGKCRVQVLAGRVPPVSQAEREALPQSSIDRGDRLACRTGVVDSVTVEALFVTAHGKEDTTEQARPSSTSSGTPPVRRFTVSVSPPTLENPVDDAAGLCAALAGAGAETNLTVDYRVARTLPTVLRSSQWRVAASVRFAEVIAVRGSEPPGAALGIAVDLGTTTLAAYLYRLDDASLLGVTTAANPLAAYGADIITRLAFAQSAPGNGARLQGILAKAVSSLAARAAEAQGRVPADIEEMVAVGNSGMHHLFLDLPGGQLINAPFVPAMKKEISIKTRELGIRVSPGAYAFLPPLVGGFVGSDLLAVALASGLDRRPGVHLVLDIGTNTELLLSADGRLSSCSTASGPALEGAALKFGTVAAPGAIQAVSIRPWQDSLRCSTIGDLPATGICGSGIIDALACLWKLGIVNRSGRLQTGFAGILPESDGDHRFVLVPAVETGLGEDITISQTEIRAIQLAKGAIRAGIDTLLADHGLGQDRIEGILIAGAFGSHVDVQSALAIGLLPPVPPDRIRTIGNAAGTGAGMMLVSEEQRREGSRLRDRITYTELARQDGFLKSFARAQWFPEEPQ